MYFGLRYFLGWIGAISVNSRSKMDLCIMENERVSELIKENEELKVRVSDLEERLSFIERHQTLALGMKGERLISGLFQGKITCHTENFDIKIHNGKRIEVKTSQLNQPVKGCMTSRWVWSKILGDSGGKDFDILLLLGVMDIRYKDFYKDSSAPYVFFLVPRLEIGGLTMKTGKTLSIQLTTNPSKARSRAASLYLDYQLTAHELKERTGIIA